MARTSEPPLTPTSLYLHSQTSTHTFELPRISTSLRPHLSPPEDKIPSGEEQHAVVKNFESQYDEARTYVEVFKMAVGSLDSYEKPLSVKISLHDWIKLSHDLEIFDTDQKYRISFHDP